MAISGASERLVLSADAANVVDVSMLKRMCPDQEAGSGANVNGGDGSSGGGSGSGSGGSDGGATGSDAAASAAAASGSGGSGSGGAATASGAATAGGEDRNDETRAPVPEIQEDDINSNCIGHIMCNGCDRVMGGVVHQVETC